MKTEIIILATRLIVAFLAAIVMPAVKSWLKEKTENEKLNRVKEWAYTAVSAAEQIYHKKKGEDPEGANRYEYARKKIYDLCVRYGIAISSEEIEAIIEAAVNELNMFNDSGVGKIN